MNQEKLRKVMGFESFLEFQRFWKSLGPKHRLQILAAIGVTFSSIGFVMDIVSFPRYRPLPLVLAAAAGTGLIAVFMAVLIFRSPRSILAAGLLLAAGTFLIGRLAAATMTWTFPADEVTFSRRLSIEAGGVLFCSMLGYALFLAFIGDEGVKRVRFMAEISLAKKLHEALVPAVDASVGGLAVYGKSLPSDEVGGDLLDFWSGGDTISVYLADVSGHGVTAGAMMGMTKSAIRVQLTTDQPLDRLLETLNDVLVDLTPTNMFLTLVSVRFRPDCVEVCSAGHLPLLRHMKGSEKIERIHSRQIPIGVLKNTGYCCSLVPRAQGDLFVLMTDGLTEVRNSAGDMFGLERIEEIVLRMPDAALPEIYQAIMEAIWAFGKQEDDQTLLLVRT